MIADGLGVVPDTLARMTGVRFGLSIGLYTFLATGFLACVGDDPAPAGLVGSDASTSQDATGSNPGDDDGGSGAVDGASDADAGPPVSKGDFAWELHADRAGNVEQHTMLAVGPSDVLGIASDYTQATTIGTLSVAGSGARTLSFLLGADKTPKWAIGLPTNDVSAVAVDGAGNVYVAGAFQAASLTLGSRTITSKNSDSNMPSGFYAKLSGVDGSVLWAVSISDANGDNSSCTSIGVRGTDVVVGCTFFGPIAFGTKDTGGGTLTTKLTTAPNDGDIVVLALDPADTTGRALWSKQVHGTQTDRLGGVTFDGAGNVVISGGFASPDLKVDTSPVATLTRSAGGADAFVMRFDGAGSHGVSLAKNWGASNGSSYAEASALAVAPSSGDIAVCGNFAGPANFGQGEVSAPAGNDAFVMRIDSGGATRWAKTYGGSGNDACNSVAFDAYDQLAIGGTHRSGSVTISGKSLPAMTGTSAGHVAKLSAAGDGLWAYAVNGTNATVGSVGFLSGGDVVYSGAFLGTTDLGGGTVQSANGGVQVSLFVVRRSP